MNLRRPLDELLRSVSRVAGVSCCLATATIWAQDYRPRYPVAPPRIVPVANRIPVLNGQQQLPYCPPGQQPPTYMPYQQQMPAQPGQSQPQDGMQRTPQGTTDPNQQQQQQQRQDPAQSQQLAQQQQQQQQPQDQQQNQQPTDFSPSNDSSRANPSPGMNTPQLGRADQVNRLNLFDNMTALPQSRVWMGVQTVSGFDTGLRFSDEFKQFISPVLSTRNTFSQNDIPIGQTTSTSTVIHGDRICNVTTVDTTYQRVITRSNEQIRRDAPADVNGLLRAQDGIDQAFFEYQQRLFRVGAEWAPNDWFSLAVQGQRYSADDDGPDDDWTQPQIMLKAVVSRDVDSILSATLGITPQTESKKLQIVEDTTKFYPGLLFYEGISPRLFAQGGCQFGLPVDQDNQVFTADWSVALSYWLYQDPSPKIPGHGSLLQRFRVSGIIPQINLLGKHTLGNRIVTGPFGLSSSAPTMQIPATLVVDSNTETSQFVSREVFEDCTSPPPPVAPPPPPVNPVAPIDCGCALAAPVFFPTVYTQSFPNGFIIYEEPEFVLDLTVGGTILFGESVQLGMGYSVALTNDPVRNGEFLSTLTYFF